VFRAIPNDTSDNLAMRIQLESQYKAGETLEIDDPHSPGSKIKIQFPHDYDANSWIEVC